MDGSEKAGAEADADTATAHGGAQVRRVLRGDRDVSVGGQGVFGKRRVERPEDIWGVDDNYLESYRDHVSYGRDEARRRRLAIVSICRNAMPHLKNTMRLIDELAGLWQDCQWYVYENDSVDGTAEALDDFARLRAYVTVEHETLGREDFRGFQPERTVRLAEYRSRCQEWVLARMAAFDYVAVLDTDPHGGFSPEGVLNSLGWFCDLRGRQCQLLEPGAMASHSLFVTKAEKDGKPALGIAAYDAYAARLNWWEDLRMTDWFHALLLPVGSPPVPMNSAFGGLCLYRRDAYLALRYAGGDCEHVHAHRAMHRAGYQLYLNPGSRYIAILPE